MKYVSKTGTRNYVGKRQRRQFSKGTSAFPSPETRMLLPMPFNSTIILAHNCIGLLVPISLSSTTPLSTSLPIHELYYPCNPLRRLSWPTSTCPILHSLLSTLSTVSKSSIWPLKSLPILCSSAYASYWWLFSVSGWSSDSQVCQTWLVRPGLSGGQELYFNDQDR